jgi:hypothetical protein
VSSDDLRELVGFPVPTRHHAALIASYVPVIRLARESSRGQVAGQSGELFLESWQVTRSVLLARMAGTLQHLLYLVPSTSRLDGAALCRTLIDHAIHYGWIAADPNERLPKFLRKSYSHAVSQHERMSERGEVLLEPDLLKRYRRYLERHPTGTGKLPAMSRAVDAAWLERVRAIAPEPIQLPSMTDYYYWVYDGFANMDHPSTVGLQTFVHLDPSSPVAWVDGEPERDLATDQQPYWLALWVMCWVLLVASLAQGRPRLSEIKDAIRRARALREYDRHGLLVVREGPTGMTLDVAPDAEARLDVLTKQTRVDG